MKSDKRVLFLLSLLIVGIAIYLPFRLGYFGGPQVAKISTKLKQLDGDSVIRDIEVVTQTDDEITISVSIFYNGEHGEIARTDAEAISTADGFEYSYAKASVPAKKGENNIEYKIVRPYSADEELAVNKIRVNLHGRPTAPNTPSVLSKDFSTQIIWPSKIAKENTGSYNFWKFHAQKAFSESHFYRLHRMFKDWNNPDLRLDDGKWRLSALGGISELINQFSWELSHQKLSSWHELFPNSEGQAILEAIYWIQYAWNARGSGYASDVTETGWQLYNERLRKAEQVLQASKDYASDNPLWYQTYIQVAMGLSWDKLSVLELFNEAVARHPNNYETYFKTAYAVSPKWGGSYQLIDAVAIAAAKHTPEPESDVIYARVYWAISAAVSEGDDFFKDTMVSWPRMKTGFYQLIDDYPNSNWNLNHFGIFACNVGDRETYLDVRKRMGESRVIDNLWTGNSSLESCDRTLMAGA